VSKREVIGPRIDDADEPEVEVCRDERCSIEEIHPPHPFVETRGDAPRYCPHCKRTIPPKQGARCFECGWSRTSVVKRGLG
jgi:hypothetical protein